MTKLDHQKSATPEQARWAAFSAEELEALRVHLSFVNAISSKVAPRLAQEIHDYLFPSAPTPEERAEKLLLDYGMHVWSNAASFKRDIAATIREAIEADRKVR